MKVIVGGETSGKVRDAFRRLGHDAISCDLLPTDKNGPHYQGSWWDIAHDEKWDLGLFFPTCTYMCNSGVHHLHTEEGRWDKMVESAEDFRRLFDLPYPIGIENPIMHGYAKEIVGRDQDQVIQPWMFGHPETKATCLWLNGLDRLRPTNDLGPPKPQERERDGLGFTELLQVPFVGKLGLRLNRVSLTRWLGNGVAGLLRVSKEPWCASISNWNYSGGL